MRISFLFLPSYNLLSGSLQKGNECEWSQWTIVQKSTYLWGKRGVEFCNKISPKAMILQTINECGCINLRVRVCFNNNIHSISWHLIPNVILIDSASVMISYRRIRMSVRKPVVSQITHHTLWFQSVWIESSCLRWSKLVCQCFLFSSLPFSHSTNSSIGMLTSGEAVEFRVSGSLGVATFL